MTPWEVLGIDADAEAGVVRRAYAARLKQTRPEDDPAGFQRLREAYELCLAWAQREPATATTPQPDLAPPPDSEPRDTALGAEAVAAPASTIAANDLHDDAGAPGADADPASVQHAVARILSACSPLDYAQDQVHALILEAPELVPLHARTYAGILIAHHVADGVSLHPAALQQLEHEFGWDDVAVVGVHPIFSDPRFLERLRRAQTGSRPSTRQHQTPASPGIGVGVVVMVGLSQAARYLADTRSGGASSRALHSATLSGAERGALIGGGLMLLALFLTEVWTHGRALSPTARRWRWVERIVLGLGVAGLALYFLGRP